MIEHDVVKTSLTNICFSVSSFSVKMYHEWQNDAHTQNREDGRDIWMDELKNHQVLNLQNVSRFSSGSYECKATNEVGEATVTFKVDVNCKYMDRTTLFLFSSSFSVIYIFI